MHHLCRGIRESPDQSLLVVLGSSRTGGGFQADLLPPPSWHGTLNPLVFNMSLSGGTPFYELLFLRRMLAAGIHPRWVVIEVLPPALNFQDKYLTDKVLPPRLRWHDLQVLGGMAPRYSGFRYWRWLKANLVPSYASRFPLLSCFSADWLSTAQSFETQRLRQSLSPRGWLPCPRHSVTRKEYDLMFQVAENNYAPALKSFQVAPEADRLVRQILDDCRKEGIEVIGLLRMPEAGDFRALYPPDASRMIDRYLKVLCREYQTDYIDASRWLEDDQFVDGHHLLPSGAERFSLRLWDEMLEKHMHGASEVALARPAELR